ncbi:hypothetical protein B0T11DRAFT_293480 [Plectosphaerella cucumerina]|uniref:Uncharacterized protein n=1 Tax=Plectosphaerella cucumerina TaxID=40658 RepID=A0A8K0X905_9PEZI|nr:hypothetical protein B0T11DRAFT_293480 [Plectosphaerella cucumerina]
MIACMMLVSTLTVLALGWASSTLAQQFILNKKPYDEEGLSEKCTKVLNTEFLYCDPMLFDRTDRTNSVINVLPRSELDLICHTRCREELSALREQILTVRGPDDVIRRSRIERPHQFAYVHDINCYKHKITGRYCDEVWRDWRDHKIEFDDCDDCYLGSLSVKLSSPLGVNGRGIDQFSSMIASCGDSSYHFATATRYEHVATSTAVASGGVSFQGTSEL